MSRKKARHLYLELSRRILTQSDCEKKIGEVLKFYNRNWKPDLRKFGGYKATWNSEPMLSLRKSVGM